MYAIKAEITCLSHEVLFTLQYATQASVSVIKQLLMAIK